MYLLYLWHKDLLMITKPTKIMNKIYSSSWDGAKKISHTSNFNYFIDHGYARVQRVKKVANNRFGFASTSACADYTRFMRRVQTSCFKRYAFERLLSSAHVDDKEMMVPLRNSCIKGSEFGKREAFAYADRTDFKKRHPLKHADRMKHVNDIVRSMQIGENL
jgi:hypothetical protein